MGAFNNIKITGQCPSCNNETEILCQTHVASSFNGLKGIRFCDNTYRIGEKMNWWDKSDEEFKTWRSGNYCNNSKLPENIDIEACYSECQGCDAEAYAIILFSDISPIAILDLGLIKQWPSLFKK